MKARIALISSIIAVVSLAFSSIVLNEPLTEFKTKLSNYVRYTAPEKTYMQTDKPYYTTGDTIWFQTYLVDGIFHLPSNKSKSIYVELISPTDTTIATRTLFPMNGGVGGDIAIPEDAEQGVYLIRAYTNYMRNQASSYFFQKELPIWKQTISDNESEAIVDLMNSSEMSASNLSRPLVNFYPEGGDLVAGINSVVGVKATTKSGAPLTLEGTIVDEAGNYMMSFKTYDMGIGTFSFKPAYGKTYTAIVDINGVEQTYTLPPAIQSGYTLSLRNLGNKVSIRARTNIAQGLEGAFIIGHLRGAAFFETIHESNENELATVFSTETLEDGVATFTLFTKSGEPVCERLVFIDNPNNDLTVSVTTDQEDYGTRKPVNVSIGLEDEGMDSIFAQVSISITDQVSVKESPYAENIKSWLLLNSDLRGEIDNPSYYFEKPGDRRRQFLLDALMLTQGWRRFVWEDLPSDSLTNFKYPIEKGITITGKTTKLENKNKPTPANLALSFIDGGYFTDDASAGADGQFQFGPYILLDTIQASLQARIPPKRAKKKKKKNGELIGNRYLSIELNEIMESPMIERRNQYISPSDTAESWLKDFLTLSKEKKKMDVQYDTRMIVLDEVTVEADRKEEDVFDDIVTSRALYTQPSNRVVVDSFPFAQAALSIFDLLRVVPGVEVFGSFPDQTALIRGPSSISLSNTPTYLLDGSVVSEGTIQSIPPQEVYFIDVLKGPRATIYGASGATGVIAVYTRIGAGIAPAATETKPGIVTFTLPGYYKTRQFFTPDYSEKKEIHIKPDYRTTLFWRSNILMANQIDSISFYTSDQASSYQIKVEGITLDGRAVYGIGNFVVK